MGWMGDPYPCNGRECRPADGGWFWHQKLCRMWEEEPGAEPEERLWAWENTGEPCEPEPPGGE
jgi:hypothetical protein